MEELCLETHLSYDEISRVPLHFGDEAGKAYFFLGAVLWLPYSICFAICGL
jgi:hypothetical protein